MILGVLAAVSIIPVVLSMNRGLWLSLGLGLVYAALRLSLKGSERALIAFVTVTILLVGALFFTPLGTTLSERLATPHSNNRRVSLYEEAVRGAAESPLFGFGAPRPSKWNPNAPSVGTQGQLWLVLFSNGYPGMLLFLAWFLATFWWFRGSAEPIGFWMHVMLVIMFLQLPVYGLLPAPIHIVMLGIALAWRERLARGPDSDRDPPGERLSDALHSHRGDGPDDRVRSHPVTSCPMLRPRSRGCAISFGPPPPASGQASSGGPATSDGGTLAWYALPSVSSPTLLAPSSKRSGWRIASSVQRRYVAVRSDPEAGCRGPHQIRRRQRRLSRERFVVRTGPGVDPAMDLIGSVLPRGPRCATGRGGGIHRQAVASEPQAGPPDHGARRGRARLREARLESAHEIARGERGCRAASLVPCAQPEAHLGSGAQLRRGDLERDVDDGDVPRCRIGTGGDPVVRRAPTRSWRLRSSVASNGSALATSSYLTRLN